MKREMVWVIIGQLVVVIGGFLLIKVLTNFLSHAEYGKLSLGLTISGLVSMFVYGPFAQGVTRFYSISNENNQLPDYYRVIKDAHFKMALAVLTISSLVVVAIYLYVGQEWAVLVFAAAIFGIFSGVNLTFTSLQNAIRNRAVVASHQGADVILRLALSAFVILFISSSGSAVISSFMLGAILILCSQWFFVKNNKTLRLRSIRLPSFSKKNRDFSKGFYKYLKPFKYFSILGAIGLFSDRWILQFLYGEEEVGVYTALYLIANTPILVLVGIASQFIVPIVFEESGNVDSNVRTRKSNALILQAVFVVIILTLPLMLVSYCYGELIIYYLTNESFVAYSNLLWLFVLGLTLFNIAQMLSIVGFSYNKPEIYILPMVVKTIVFIFFGYQLAVSHQIYGVVYALCISGAIYLGLVIAANRSFWKAI